ncbi:ABC transporter permease [Bacillus sp. FJAT-49705]|uniref:ABC transporter permease n=1 Tax=Cytobacillus citreus TaxID=2833586 RepID=A0ABS5NYK0_9BACI|nr:ABC transporter permease [Cytobacillus citreus]
MFNAFLKKQLLVFIRNPEVIILQLVMPIVLITILGFALGGLFEGEKSPIEAKVAYVSQGNEEDDIEEFKTFLQKSRLDPEAIAAIEGQIKTLLPLKILREDVFENDKLKEFVHVKEVEPEKLTKLKKNKDYAVIIEVPEKFTYHFLMSVFFPSEQTSEKPELKLYQNEDRELASQLVADIIEDFQHQYTLQTALAKIGIPMNPEMKQPAESEVSIQSISAVKSVSAIAYYTIGISMMFVLYVASMAGTFAFAEKESNVYTRIILSRASRTSYLMGTFISAIIIAFIQLLILFGFSFIAYGVKWDDLSSFLAITICIAIAVGGFATLVTTLNYRFHSQTFSNFFSSIGVTIFALLGGTFVPVKGMSETVAEIGKLTPDGAAMNAYLNIYQGYGIETVIPQLVTLCIYGMMLAVIGVSIFPKEVRQ